MKRRIRMIGLDLDGTLLTTQKEMTAYTRDVLARALEQGVHVMVSTGRPISAIPKDILEIPGMKFAVTSNGARVLDLETKEVLIEHTIPVETAKKLIRIIREYDALNEVFLEGAGYSQGERLQKAHEYFSNPSMAEYMMKSRTGVEDVVVFLEEKKQPVEKVQGVFKSLDERKLALERMKQLPGIIVTGAFENNLEINREGTDKGKALLQLGALLGIPRDEIMACGDGMNDYQMLSQVGFAVAMENGHKKLKEIADYVTVTNDEDGVAKAIKKFVLN